MAFTYVRNGPAPRDPLEAVLAMVTDYFIKDEDFTVFVDGNVVSLLLRTDQSLNNTLALSLLEKRTGVKWAEIFEKPDRRYIRTYQTTCPEYTFPAMPRWMWVLFYEFQNLGGSDQWHLCLEDEDITLTWRPDSIRVILWEDLVQSLIESLGVRWGIPASRVQSLHTNSRLEIVIKADDFKASVLSTQGEHDLA